VIFIVKIMAILLYDFCQLYLQTFLCGLGFGYGRGCGCGCGCGCKCGCGCGKDHGIFEIRGSFPNPNLSRLGGSKISPEIKDPHDILGFGCGFGKDQGDLLDPHDLKDPPEISRTRTRTRADYGDISRTRVD
jgi:hypothetical protein